MKEVTYEEWQKYIYFEINDEKYYSDDIEAWAELPRVEE